MRQVTTVDIQTAGRRFADLMNPSPEHIDLEGDVAFALSHVNRFTGHAGAYSVAQHSVMACDVVLDETRRADLAAYALLHDAHEAYLGDLSTPMAEALARAATHYIGSGDESIRRGVRRAIADLKERHDRAVHGAAGLAWPRAREADRAVHDIDLRLLKAERDRNLGFVLPWFDELEAARPIRMAGDQLRPWPAGLAQQKFVERLRRILPKARAMQSDGPSRMPMAHATAELD